MSKKSEISGMGGIGWYIVSLISMVICLFFFFSSRRRHTRYWRDWSSDVCSSDLQVGIINAKDHKPKTVRIVALEKQLKLVMVAGT